MATGIVDSSLVPIVAQRLFEPDLFTGWGIRKRRHRRILHNPYSYHRGSVWPKWSKGNLRIRIHSVWFNSRLYLITKGQFEAAALFASHRLPEAFSGHTRDPEHPFPGLTPQANAPQAWSASTVFLMLQAMLGVYPCSPPVAAGRSASPGMAAQHHARQSQGPGGCHGGVIGFGGRRTGKAPTQCWSRMADCT